MATELAALVKRHAAEMTRNGIRRSDAADRAGARAGWLAGTPVTALLKTIPAEHG